MRQIKFATIGTSNITEQFIAGTKISGKLEHSAVYSRSEEKGKAFSQKYGNLPVYTSLEALAESSVEAVYVASPNKAHYEQCKFLLERGKHIICEKSISAHPEQVEELQCIAQKNNLVFMEAIMFMHLPAKKILSNALEKIGNIKFVNLNFCQRSSRYDALMRGELPNIFNPECETGALLDLGVYCVYPALYYFSAPDSLKAYSVKLATGVDGSGSITLEYKDKIVNLNYSKLCQGFAPSEFVGDEGCVTVGSISQLSDIRFYDKCGKESLLWTGEDKPHLMSHEASAFADFITYPEQNKKYYDFCSELALQVSRVMYKARTQSDVLYPSDGISVDFL